MPLSQDPPALVLRKEVGRGAGSVVHLAEGAPGAPLVAVKTLLRPDAPGACDGLLREHAILSRCRHPHLVRTLGLLPDAAVLDASQLGAPAALVGPALLLEHVSGQDLAHATLTQEQAIEAWVQVAHALDALHALGFVHRDLKPANVLLRDAPGRVDAVLCDLGLALRADAPDQAPGGTLDFLAPETLAGSPPTAATDVHGLGGLLYYLLTGHAPWSDASIEDSLRARQRGAPPIDAGARVSPELAGVVAALLAPHPVARPAGAMAAVRLLNRATGARHPDRPGSFAARPGVAPWVGRAEALLVVDQQLAAAAADEDPGAVRVVWITGAEGSGRSRLLSEVAARARLLGLPVLWRPMTAPPPRAVVLVDDDAGLLGPDGRLPPPAAGTWFIATSEAAPAPVTAAQRIELGPLAPRECLDLAAALLGLPHVEGGDGDALRAACGGLPGPLEHVVAALARGGALVVEGEHLRVDAQAARAVPGLKEALAARFEGLSAVASVVLDRAALLDGPSLPDRLRELSGLAPDSSEFVMALVELQEAGLLRESPLAAGGSGLEPPAVVREAVAAALSPPRRVLLHLAAAAALGRSEGSDPGARARHLDAAGAPDRAAPLHRAAGELCLADGHPLEAAAHLRRALASTAFRGAERGRILVALAKALAPSGDAAGAVEAVREACELLEDEAESARALAFAAEAASHAGDPRVAEDACRRARKLFRKLGSATGRAECTSRLGLLAAARGDGRRARAAYNAALSLARREGDRALTARVLNNIGELERRAGRLAEAATALAEARALREALGDRVGAAKATNNLGIVQGMAGRLDEAAAAFGAAADAFSAAGERREHARCRNNRGLVLWRRGRLAEADEELDRAAALFRETNDPVLTAVTVANRGLVALDRGQLAAARTLLESAAGMSEGSEGVRARALFDLGDVLRALGDLAGARSAHERAQAAFGRIDEGLGDAAVAGLAASVDAALAGQGSQVALPPGAAEGIATWPAAAARRWHVEAGRLTELAGEAARAAGHAVAARALLDADASPAEVLDIAVLEAGPSPDERGVEVLRVALERAAPGTVPEPGWRARLRFARGLTAAGRADEAREAARAGHEALLALAASLGDGERAAWVQASPRAEALAELDGLAAPAAEPGAANHAPGTQPDVPGVLLEFVRLLNAHLDVDELMPRLVDFAIELSGADRGCLILFDDGPERVRVARSRAGQRLDRATFQPSQTIVERVRSTGQPVVVASFQSEADAPRSASIHDLRLGSATCVPLPAPPGVGGGTLGALYVDSAAGRTPFGPRDVETLTAIAAHGATALVNAQLLARVRAEKEALESEVSLLSAGAAPEERFGGVLGRSQAMRDVFALLERVAGTDASVLIEGESGTGKEVVAKSLHARSRRAGKAFVVVDCGGLPESLIESELFGHRRGAFTGADRDRPGLFEQASGGTILLDEVAGMSPAVQAKLLRVLQEREVRRVGENTSRAVDVRVIAASNRPLETEVAAGRFREDLYYRLNVLRVRLPPLRERSADVPLLARHLLDAVKAREGLTLEGWQPAALAVLVQHSWPGNVRELANVVERAALVARGPLVSVADLPSAVAGRGPSEPAADPAGSAVTTTGASPAAAEAAPRPEAAAAVESVPAPERELWRLVVEERQDFWRVVRDAYVDHAITRDDVKALVSQALLRTSGSYKEAARLLGIEDADYKRLMDFLRQNRCRIDFRPYRAAAKRA